MFIVYRQKRAVVSGRKRTPLCLAVCEPLCHVRSTCSPTVWNGPTIGKVKMIYDSFVCEGLKIETECVCVRFVAPSLGKGTIEKGSFAKIATAQTPDVSGSWFCRGRDFSCHHRLPSWAFASIGAVGKILSNLLLPRRVVVFTRASPLCVCVFGSETQDKPRFGGTLLMGP